MKLRRYESLRPTDLEAKRLDGAVKDKKSETRRPQVKLPEVYYLSENDRYYLKDSEGDFRGYRKSPTTARLKHEFLMKKEEYEEFFAEIYRKHVIDCVTPIGGKQKGLHNIGGKRVLVPTEQRRIKPEKGDWQITRKYLLGMFGEEQLEWYLGWLKTWLDGYYSYRNTIGQVLIAIGDTASGKTLLKEIHNHIFDGGGQPLKYMTGGTGFNGELCSRCSLYIDDKLNDLGAKGKKKLKAECKEMAVAGEMRFEFKNQTAFTASPCFRLLICCNYTEDSVSVIPDIDESTKNKISIVHCSRKEMPMPAGNAKEREAFWKKLESEMPAFIHHVLNEHEISEEMSDKEEGRMGVRGYHNDQSMNYVESYSNDGSRLLAIVECLRKKGGGPSEDKWRGSAGALSELLKIHDVEKFGNPTSIGRFLNQRIKCGSKLVRSVGHREYEIDLTDPSEIEAPSFEESIEEEVSVQATDSQADFDLYEDAPFGHYSVK